jgi:hypothetical protein
MHSPRRILVVANRTAAAPRLLDEVGRRARAGACEFTLLIPDAPDRRSANWTLEIALPLLERAARAPVKSTVGGADAFASVEAAVRDGDYDELIVSTLPRRFSRWLRRDLISQIAELGLPVTAIVPRRAPAVAAAEEALRTPRDLGGGP